jgi:DNA-directed RNA polymerase specialized sigma24 family protein
MSQQGWEEREARVAGWVESWLAHGDQLAATRATDALSGALWADRFSAALLGLNTIDEVRQEVLTKLLDRDVGLLQGKARPVAYARRAWKNAIKDRVRSLRRRTAREPILRASLEVSIAPDDAGRLHDFQAAMREVECLPLKRRLAVLLVARPGAIDEAAWATVVKAHPPPPPAIPRVALERRDAAVLLYPRQPGEDAATHRARAGDAFDKALKRAIADIRERLGGGR